MIEIKGVSKKFGNIQALSDIHATIQEGEVFGLIGSNGAGKSTLFRILSGILRQDEGKILVDGQAVYENAGGKSLICFLADGSYFLPNTTPGSMGEHYAMFYPKFDKAKYEKNLKEFGIDKNRKMNTFSKGMKKQVSILLGIHSNTKYLFCDETFDGLDPVMRQAVKSLFISEMMKRPFTPVIASHNLRELEDICEHVGLLHKGGILFTKDLDEMKLNLHKVQCVFQNPVSEEEALKNLDILKHEKRGSLLTLVTRGRREKVMQIIQEENPLFAEVLPLTLEEIFISETEVAGYDIKDFIF